MQENNYSNELLIEFSFLREQDDGIKTRSCEKFSGLYPDFTFMNKKRKITKWFCY